MLLDIGSVLTWHMYHPLSVSLVSRMWRHHLRWPLCVTAIRWFFVITCVAIVRIVCVSTRSHATCQTKETIFICSIFNSIRDTSNDIKYHRPMYPPMQTEAASLKGNLTWNAFHHGTWAKLNLLYSSAMLLSNFTNFEEFHSSWRDIVLDVEERRNQFIYQFLNEIPSFFSS